MNSVLQFVVWETQLSQKTQKQRNLKTDWNFILFMLVCLPCYLKPDISTNTVQKFHHSVPVDALSSSPPQTSWNVHILPVSELHRWIIFGLQPEGISVKALLSFFFLMMGSYANIYQVTNYCTQCSQTYAHKNAMPPLERFGCIHSKKIQALPVVSVSLTFALNHMFNSVPGDTPVSQSPFVLQETFLCVPISELVMQKGIFCLKAS